MRYVLSAPAPFRLGVTGRGGGRTGSSEFLGNRRNRNLFLFLLDCAAIMDNDVVKGDAKKARGMRRKMEYRSRARGRGRKTVVVVVVVEGDATSEEKRENNGEFNMAPRGSFNHLIESPAYPPSPSLLPFVVRTFVSHPPRRDEYLR